MYAQLLFNEGKFVDFSYYHLSDGLRAERVLRVPLDDRCVLEKGSGAQAKPLYYTARIVGDFVQFFHGEKFVVAHRVRDLRRVAYLDAKAFNFASIRLTKKRLSVDFWLGEKTITQSIDVEDDVAIKSWLTKVSKAYL